MNNGIVASYLNNDPHGEDAFVIRELGDTESLDVVLDGVTRCEGAYASGFTSQMLQDAQINGLSDLVGVLEQANTILFENGKGRNLLTTVSAALKIQDELHVINLGDSPVFLIRGSEIRELSTVAQSAIFRSAMVGAVGLREEFGYEYTKLDLRPHDRLVLATDGLINNISPEEVVGCVQSSADPEDAITALKELIGEKKRLHKGRKEYFGTFRQDDETVILRYFG